MMKLSTNTDYCVAKFGIEKAIDMICDAGFEALDLSMFDILRPSSPFFGDDYLEVAKKAKEKAESRGVYFNQAHAPFPCYKVDNEEYNTAILPAIYKAIEIAGVIGAKQIIVHPTYLDEGKKEFNMNFYNSLIPLCEKYNIKIALENMFGHKPNDTSVLIPNVCSLPEDFKDYVESLDKRYFTACLDLGHCGVVGVDVVEMIKTLGSNLTALHIHDNDGVRDLHSLPFLHSIDFKAIAKALKEIGYTGDITLEADYFLRRLPAEMAADGLYLMRASAEKIRSLILNA